MFNKKRKYLKDIHRSRRGSIIAENASVMYILFILIIFPLIDLSAIGLRTFFFWYCCNQAVMAGAKCSQWSTTIAAGTYGTSIQTQSLNALAQSLRMFSGISITVYPKLSVILRAINHSDTTNNQTTASTVTLSSSALPLTTKSTPPIVDPSQYVPILRLTSIGQISPFISVPFFFPVPGLNQPFPVTVNVDQIIENPASLNG